ncbi:MAG: hypothetical protein M3Q12_05860, partial [Pseudomonadota bacterium]|nr:hypothetical protein [Pseudomonadota bacterium]
AEISACLSDITNAAGGAGRLASDEDRMLMLQDKLKCGTNCGSCVPEIKRIIRASTEGRHLPSPPAGVERAVIPIKVIA